MKFFSKVVGFICSSFLLLSPALVQANDSSRDKEIADRFAKCDINHDGKLTRDEANGCMPRIYSNFSSIDSANKGYVTVSEIQAMVNR